ncbi:MAG: nitrous oxide reductase accessory protein NosL [Burkholderiales bacterium]|nr:nitrous oxide reductase accessory protein NosL [Burkholderiales bacterium]
MKRRAWLQRAGVLGPLGPLGSFAPFGSLGLAAFACGAAGCSRSDESWPEGMRPIKWDRDTCARCSMVISDPRFAVQVRGGPRDETFKFDDIGCAVMLGIEKRAQHPWLNDAAVRWWVADVASEGKRWLNARQAHFVGGMHSPMGYDFAAFASAQPGSVGFEAMLAQVREGGR